MVAVITLPTILVCHCLDTFTEHRMSLLPDPANILLFWADLAVVVSHVTNLLRRIDHAAVVTCRLYPVAEEAPQDIWINLRCHCCHDPENSRCRR